MWCQHTCAGEISEATEGDRILLSTCQSSCSVVQCDGAEKTREACNGPAIKLELPILLSDPACSAGEIKEPMPPIMPNTMVVFFSFVFVNILTCNLSFNSFRVR